MTAAPFLKGARPDAARAPQAIGAISAETQQIEGQWEHRGKLHRDLNVRVFVDVADNAENRQFFVEYKERLKARFQQIDIWLTTYLIEVI